MRYGSVCSGIEAASVAWKPLGWEPQFFSEIEPFPSAVLAHHWPDVPNLGDMTNFKEWPDAAIDVLVGGTPCQSFSVAGLRRGLDDPRGNLALTFLAIADQYRPRWVVWENVPGVLSSNGGRDFGAFLGGLVKLGYGFSYRVLDAQFFGVAQRRRRVFVVGHLGDWRRAAAVLFEREGLSGNPPPSRGQGQDTAADAGHGPAVPILEPGARTGKSTDDRRAGIGVGESGDPMFTLQAGKQHGVACAITGDITHALNTANNGKGCSEDGTGRGVPTIAFTAKDYGADAQADLSPTLRAGGYAASHANAGVMPAVCFAQNSRSEVRQVGGDGQITGALAADHGVQQQHYVAQPVAFQPGNLRRGAGAPPSGEVFPTVKADHGRGLSDQFPHVCQSTADTLTSNWHKSGGAKAGKEAGVLNPVFQGLRVRRLMPVECERLQGFPDGHTAIPYRNKPVAADGPRYKAIGNSMAVPCMQWIGRKIQIVDKEFAA
ncbi:DNA (cytosine-5-)-methyltransferase [Halomonas sp. I1]|uniref:DNA cytosine methyltransferase n=1 Tax=Halomonas sp. I1 TaxID=393536 RepID=UPI0028E0334D|nr:DNA (cytosine-5-)-methyltransferase [Halomonas sp. I1]MDT8894207.1 DNA (cytosine-5-)-methyltransferase [Halomonas sp. I1]